MRLEIEVDYEVDEDEEKRIVACAEDRSIIGDVVYQIKLRQEVQNILGYSGLVVQNVGVCND